MEHRLVVCAPSGVPTPLKQESGHNVRLAHRQNARVPNSGEGGKKGESEKHSDRKPGARIFEPVRLIRQRDAEPRSYFLGSAFAVTRFGIRPSGSDREKTSSQKRRMRVERTALPRVLLSKQEDLKCKKTVRYFFWSRFSPRRFAAPRIHRRHLRRNQSQSSSLELGRTFRSINRPPALV